MAKNEITVDVKLRAESLERLQALGSEINQIAQHAATVQEIASILATDGVGAEAFVDGQRVPETPEEAAITAINAAAYIGAYCHSRNARCGAVSAAMNEETELPVCPFFDIAGREACAFIERDGDMAMAPIYWHHKLDTYTP